MSGTNKSFEEIWDEVDDDPGAEYIEPVSKMSFEEFLEKCKKAISFLKSVPDDYDGKSSLPGKEVYIAFVNEYNARVPADRKFTVKNFHQVFRKCHFKTPQEMTDEELRGCFQSVAKITRLGEKNVILIKDDFLPYFEEWVNRNLNEYKKERDE